MSPDASAIRVLIVDDSATARRAIAACLAQAGDLQVVGAAHDAAGARELMTTLRPQVMTLDVGMPELDGLSFLREIMHERPLPVVIVSAATPRGSQEAIRALELGAAAVVPKPTTANRDGFGDRLARAVRSAASTARGAPPRPAPSDGAAADDGTVLAIGASTGGPEAVRFLIERLPADTPPTIIVQHLPPPFTASFAQRLDECGAMSVGEAIDGEIIVRGRAVVAPAGRHLRLRRAPLGVAVALDDGEPEHFQRPSIDVAFRSVAEAVGPRALGVILTGMGRDGAAGLLAMRRAGARTIAQDEGSSVIFGMPRAAADLGAADEVSPLTDIPRRIRLALADIASRSRCP